MNPRRRLWVGSWCAGLEHRGKSIRQEDSRDAIAYSTNGTAGAALLKRSGSGAGIRFRRSNLIADDHQRRAITRLALARLQRLPPARREVLSAERGFPLVGQGYGANAAGHANDRAAVGRRPEGTLP